MSPARRYVTLAGIVFLAACGGGTATSSSKSASNVSVASSDTAASQSTGTIDKTISSVLEAGIGQRGTKEDAPGKVRFGNFLTPGGKTVDVDVWWGQPDEGDKVATLKAGEVSQYVTPRRPKGFSSAVYSVTPVGSKEVLWSWDRFSPKKGDQLSVLWYTDTDQFFETVHDETLTTIDSLTNKPQFPAADSGKVRLRWFVLGQKTLDQGDTLLVVSSAGKCLTNGSGIADETGAAAFDNTTVQVSPGVTLNLSATCDGAAISAPVTTPAGGRALLFAYLDAAGKPSLKLLPVAEPN